MILQAIFNLWVSFAESEILSIWLYPLLGLGFLATFPVLVRRFTFWR